MAKVTITFTDKGNGIEIIATPLLSQLIKMNDELTEAESCAAWALKLILEEHKKHKPKKIWTPTIGRSL